MKNSIIFVDFENIVKTLKAYASIDTEKIDFFNKLQSYLKDELRILDIIVYANFNDPDFRNTQSQSYIQSLGFSTRHNYNKIKNGSDIELIIEALKIAYTNNNVETYVIVSGDKDFGSLYKALRQEGKEVYVITFNVGNNTLIKNVSDKYLLIEDIFNIVIKEDNVNITTDDEIINNIIDIETISENKIQEAKNLSKLLYESWLWKDYIRNRTKIGLLGYIDVVNKNVLTELDKSDILELFKIAYALEYVIIWKDIDGMYYLEEGKNKNMVIR